MDIRCGIVDCTDAPPGIWKGFGKAPGPFLCSGLVFKGVPKLEVEDNTNSFIPDGSYLLDMNAANDE